MLAVVIQLELDANDLQILEEFKLSPTAA